MATQDTAAFERLLATLDWEVASSRRHERFTAWPLRPSPGRAVVVYVCSGEVSVSLESAPGQGASTCKKNLGAGDILIASGRSALRLGGDAATDAIVTELSPVHEDQSHASALPDLLFVRDFATVEPAIAGLAASMGRSDCSLSRAGDTTVCARIATTIVAAAVRAWAELDCAPEGWLTRAQDPFVARALDAMHEEPGRAWTVGDLATVAAMSRTVFAQRFRELVGQAPASYLAGVRMSAAKSHLAREGRSVSETAHLLGYDSEAGFSRAFRRHTGATPSAFKRERALERSVSSGRG